MKLTVLTCTLLLAGLAASPCFAASELHGVMAPGGYSVIVDTAFVTAAPPAIDTFLTPGWQADSTVPVDSFDFPDVADWPMLIELAVRIDGAPGRYPFPGPIREVWYRFPGVQPPAPGVMFWAPSGVQENPARPEAAPRLRVSPSVVTNSALISANLPPWAGNELLVCDASGRPVRTLRLERRADGTATTTWRGDDESGALVPGGIYFCRAAGGPAAKLLVAR
ncbi:hypothetical protein JXB37_08080 [candidate division WOR-3 bacterium]|nr:hypothetical protein [candidate division WOR-3 bacterium]